MGWNRHSVQLGLNERRTGLICVDNTKARGRHKSEQVLPNLETDIRSLVDTKAQADPKLQSTYLFYMHASVAIDVKIRLIYYPPYPSKYNPIERCWAVLENYWNGAILDSVEAAVQWAANMTRERYCTDCASHRDYL